MIRSLFCLSSPASISAAFFISKAVTLMKAILCPSETEQSRFSEMKAALSTFDDVDALTRGIVIISCRSAALNHDKTLPIITD